MDAKKIARINELAHKKKVDGLTPEELEEQSILRREYIDAFKNNLKAQLDSIVIVDETDGHTHTHAEGEECPHCRAKKQEKKT